MPRACKRAFFVEEVEFFGVLPKVAYFLAKVR